MVIKCKCTHEYQDKKYGRGNRVYVPTAKGARCTVCETTITDESKKESKNIKKK